MKYVGSLVIILLFPFLFYFLFPYTQFSLPSLSELYVYLSGFLLLFSIYYRLFLPADDKQKKLRIIVLVLLCCIFVVSILYRLNVRRDIDTRVNSDYQRCVAECVGNKKCENYCTSSTNMQRDLMKGF